MQQRLLYVDQLKGFAIYLVVLGHILQHYFSDETLAVRVVYAFHIPLFMFMSGYVCFRKHDWDLISRRAVQLLVPFFSSIIISYLIKIATGTTHMSVVQYSWNVLLHPDHGLWFLWALFFISTIFIACRKFAKWTNISEWLVFLAVAAILNGIEVLSKFKLFGYHWIAWYFIYFVTGVAWRIIDEKTIITIKGYAKILSISILLFPIMVYFFRMHNEPPTFYQWVNLGSLFPVFYRFAIGIIGILLCLSWIRIVNHNNLILSTLRNWGGVHTRYLLHTLLHIRYSILNTNIVIVGRQHDFNSII